MTAATASVVAPVRDHAAFQSQRIADYQDELARAGGDPRHVSAVGMSALQDVLDDIDRLLRKVIRDQLVSRFPGQPPDYLFDECLSEARMAVIKATREYKPGTRAFSNWVLDMRTRDSALAAIRATISQETRAGELTKGQEDVLHLAHGIRAQLRAAGVEPTVYALTDAVHDRCLAHARGLIRDKWIRTARTVPDESDADAWDALQVELLADAEAKLTKDGITAALRDLPDLLLRGDRPAAFDPTVIDASVQTFAGANIGEDDEVSDLARVAVCAMSPADRQMVWAHMFDDSTRGTPARRGRLAELLTQAQAQLAAPHAHFAALSAGLELQFEQLTPAGDYNPQSLRAAVRQARLGD